MKHFDILNQPIEVGDYVVASRSGTNFPSVMKVTKLTDKKVSVINPKYPSDKASKDPKTLVVVTKQMEYAKDTWPEFYI